MADAVPLLKGYEKAKQYRDAISTTWREASDLVRPMKDDIGTDVEQTRTPDQTRFDVLYDTTAIDANQTYAAGCMSWMTPSETNWFSFDAPTALSGDDAIQSWYSKCTDETRRILAESNFYSRIHESYLDDGAFGTSGLVVEEDLSDGLRFETLQIGQYAILENNKREVDTLFRDLRLTARQAAKEFGEDNLAKDVKEQLRIGSDEKRLYVHVIMPRDDADRIAGKIDAQNMPWASLYIDTKEKKVIREGGSWENPGAVHRHLLWGASPYGYAPAMQTLADVRQLNHMQELLDESVQKHVTPPVLVPNGYKGKINLQSGGYTYFKNNESIPRYWPNQGNYAIGEDRVEFRRTQINRAFHVELFQALAAVPVGKEMTAAEVHMRQRDRLTLFSPTFARKNTELNNPIMRRVFAILLRNGAYPPPPPNLVQQSPDGLPFLPDPQINYTSRLSLQIKSIHNESFLRSVEMISPVAAMDPSVMDHFDFDNAARGIARNEGLPEKWLKSERDVEEIRMARQRQQEEMEAEESALQEADAVAKLASSNVIAGAA